MDSFELNKILGAFLFTCLALLSLNIAAEAVFHPVKPAKPGFDVVVVEKAPAGGAAPVADEPIAQRLASATVEKGENAAKKCAACHTFGKGEPDRVGPNLYGVVGRPKGTEGGFAYSPAIKGKGGNWTVEDLDTFLAAPAKYAPGTKMSFAGIPRGSERADLITYMNSKSDKPAAAAEGGGRGRRPEGGGSARGSEEVAVPRDGLASCDDSRDGGVRQITHP